MADTNDPQVYHTRSQDFSIVVNKYGDADGTHDQFKDSDPNKINDLINGIYAANRFAYQRMLPDLETIKSDLAACWQGENADDALKIVGELTTDASTIGENTRKCGDALVGFQKSWIALKNQALNLKTGFSVTDAMTRGDYSGGNDQGAHEIFKSFTKSMETAMHQMPGELYYHTPLGQRDDGPGPGPGGPGPGAPGVGPGVGPGGIGPGVGPGVGPGHGPGGIGPGTGPGYGPGGIGPGTGPGYGPGGIGPGTGPGAHADTGAGLAGFGPGGPGGIGPGVGPGAGGIGPGDGAGLSGAGAGSGAGGGAGAGGVGPGAGAGATGGRGMMPMQGGHGGEEEERERSTWLTEDDDVWGGDDGLPPVLN